MKKEQEWDFGDCGANNVAQIYLKMEGSLPQSIYWYEKKPQKAKTNSLQQTKKVQRT